MKQIKFPFRLGFIVFYSWGIDIKFSHTYLVLAWRASWHVFVSPNGTPGEAIWGWGLDNEDKKRMAYRHQHKHLCNKADRHDWEDVYYGTECRICGLFIPSGCEPWAPYEGGE